ncbi:MAG: histidinol dehydrogenase, partial [Coriobacteriales bacterium]|nr:histidinol dehydrogenase [Coriobacteriales bacterium]
MQVVNLQPGEKPSRDLVARSSAFSKEVRETVAQIIRGVRERGDAALHDYTLEFDKVDVKNPHINAQDIARSVQVVSRHMKAGVADAIQAAAANITAFHEKQRRNSWFDVRENGAFVGSKVTPLDSVGIYVPGGRALYPSTVLMNAIPAKVAGVRRIVMMTPPDSKGNIDPALLFAAHISGVTEIHVVGGAQAIAALAYGTESIKPVDKITGPGNAFVACAKRMVAGDVGIDMVAGPSEVCVLADDTSEPSLIAIDLMAQAEHDPQAACFLVTTDPELATDVPDEINAFMEDSPRADITRKSLDDNGVIFVAPDLSTALLAANTIAPEHLEVHMDNAMDLLGLIDNAGAIFLGPWTPESVGDYVAG